MVNLPILFYEGEKYYDDAEPFPNDSVNAFNKDFVTKDEQAKKAAQFFTKTSNGTFWMNGSVENITQNADKTISFNYVATATAIKTVNIQKTATTRIYTLDGRYVGDNPRQLPRGLYVSNGKKMVK